MIAYMADLLFVQGFIGSFLASLGFGVLFNVRGKALIYAGFTGALGGLVYKACSASGINESVSNFLAAVALSIAAEIFARKLKTTVSTFSACALIPLVPGGMAYEMMVEFSNGHAVSGIMKALDMVSISGMLAIGMLMVSTMTRFFYYTRKKISKTRQMVSRQHFFRAVKTSRKKREQNTAFKKNRIKSKTGKKNLLAADAEIFQTGNHTDKQERS